MLYKIMVRHKVHLVRWKHRGLSVDTMLFGPTQPNFQDVTQRGLEKLEQILEFIPKLSL